ncbi:dTDP-4-dehydrorhamnose 3,5-epimerase family protein, partial [Allomuricauda sp. AC10]|uniref:dTDP-4-dehydrorhamnose 3,5-epimerase family protein n=2 Tax=Flavobacteriales TaxID=200644 RepID=UPI00234A5C48
VLSESAHFFYKCDNYYNKESEGGINYKDSGLNIDWQLQVDKIKVSKKDMELPVLTNVVL